MSTDRDGLARRLSEASTANLEQVFTAVSPSDKPRPDCPPAGKIWESVRGELAPAAFRDVVRHVARCPICTEAWRIAETLEHSYEGEQQSVFRFFRSRRAGVVAAAAVLVLAVGLQMQDGGDVLLDGQVATVRSGTSSGEMMMINEEGSCPRENCLLSWTGPVGTESYELWVHSAGDPLNPLVRESGLESSEYLVPAAVLAELPPGAVLLVILKAAHPTKNPRPHEFEVVLR